MQIINGEVRCADKGAEFPYMRGLRADCPLILPFREEDGEIVYDIRSRTCIPDLFDREPDVFFRFIEKIPLLLEGLEEYLIEKAEICWKPEFIFCFPETDEIRVLWLSGEECQPPETAFCEWAKAFLQQCIAEREANEEKLLLAVRLCQAFDGSRSFSKSVSVLTDYFQELMLKKEEKEGQAGKRSAAENKKVFWKRT